ncbi:MAG TPA: efflux RND transporter permease subunit, partial [Candidatus Sulfotelmatobacter sp.]|nr:efflux RND transporter permease subunit [Candidatus Sulfotelmatobacter sp.]
TLLMAAIVVIGISGYKQLPISALPNVDFPTIQVSATLPGASPETMASSVATPLEKQFSTIAGVSSIISTSTLGSSVIVLQFDLDRNIDGAALDVQSAMTAAAKNLPIEMTTPPSFQKVNPADQPILYISLNSSILSLSDVDEYAENMMAQRISQLSGVAQVFVYGSQKYAVRVQVNPKAMASRNISLDDVQNAVAAATSNTPVGALTGPQQQWVLQATGQPSHAADYRKLIVAYRNGAPVRLNEIATLVDSVQNDQAAAWYITPEASNRSVILAIQRQPGANTVEVVDSVKALLPEFAAVLPPSVNTKVMFDRSISIRRSIDDVRFTLGLTIILVVLVIFLFLRKISATIIPALALPVSIIGTCAGMYFCGFSIDNISLMALTLSVGFVVDDAIVMLENIVRHVEHGERPMQAALRGSREIAFTILSMTISLVAVFVPVLFMGGVIGRLFREFAVTISLAIVVSGIVSLTLTPMLCSRFLRPHSEEHENWAGRMLEAGFQAALRAYDRSLQAVLRHRLAMLIFTLVTVAATVYGYMIVPKGFLPIEDNNFIFALTETRQDISFPAMSAEQQQIADIIRTDPDVVSGGSFIGAFGVTPLNQGRLFFELKPRPERGHEASMEEVIQRLRKKLAVVPGINVFMQPVQNISFGGRLGKGAYQYTLQSVALDQLYIWAPRLEAAIRKLPGLQDVSSDLQIKSPQLIISVDKDRALSLGVNADQVRNTLYSAFGTRQVATIYTPSDDFEVILELDKNYQQSAGDLNWLYVRSSTGQLVPLDSIATISRGIGPLTVNHQGQLPAVTITFNLAPGVALGEAVDRIHEVERKIGLPVAVQSSFQGTAQLFQQSLQGQGLLLLAAVAVIYIILGILYESFIHPITILSGLPAAGLGALITLAFFHKDLSVIAVIGIVMLIGIVKKNAIMMIDFALEQKRQGETDATKAIYDACLLRFRPIMMTTMCALMGTFPIAVGSGAGSELRQPLGIAVVGGLLLSQLLTLYITPVIYVYLDRLEVRLSGRKLSVPAPVETRQAAE